jgi:hypothetical protein
MQRGQDAGNGNRMGNIRIAGLAHLALMRRTAEFNRYTDVFDILRLKIGGEFLY